MTRMLYIESSISALQNRGGYRCHAVIDNPSDRIYHALSRLFVATSDFCRLHAYGMPPTCHHIP